MKTVTEYEIEKLNYSTSHLLHFIITILSLGFWSVVWICVTLHDNHEKRIIKKKIDVLKSKEVSNE